MDRGIRLRTADRRTARPHHSSRAYPGDERRQLPPQAKPPQKESTRRLLRRPLPTRLRGEGTLPLRSRAPSPPKTTASSSLLVAPFYAATVVYFYSALDSRLCGVRYCCSNCCPQAFLTAISATTWPLCSACNRLT